ncbi:MAG: hypothetical protein ABI471_06410 [Sphingomonas bacterium]
MFARALIALLLLATPFLLVGTPAMAAEPAGRWAFRAGDKTLFQFELHRTAKGWTGIWVRPAHFASDGDSFSNVTGPAIQRSTISARELDDVVELSFDDPRPGATPDIFRIHAIDADHAEALYVGAHMEPFALVREANGARIGPWDPERSYVRQIDRPTNAEMSAIYDADQKARQDPKIDWALVGPADEQRRVRTQALLDTGALRSGADFLHAAFVFQHGGKPDDYLEAHLLAMIAVARGKPAALWIGAATLDRYLQSIGQPQVLGTQFTVRQDGKASQDPYARELLPDSLRQALRVPTLADQEQQRREYERRAASAKP